MTFGGLLDKARRSLSAAEATLTTEPPTQTGQVIALITPRRDVYAGLARLVTLLHGGRPARADRSADAAGRAARHADCRTAVYLGLDAATRLAVRYEQPMGVADSAAVPLRRAADAIDAAGDLIATHVEPHRRPRTPEGAAIRAGGGVAAALADVGTLTRRMLSVDANLVEWIQRADPRLVERLAPMTDGVVSTLSGALGHAAEELVVDAAAPRLLDLLTPAAYLSDAPAAVTSVSDVVDALVAVRDWLWKEPGQVHAVHLRIATQFGVAVSAVTASANDVDQTGLRAWRRASAAASQIDGSTPRGPSADTAETLKDLLRWAHERLDGSAAVSLGSESGQCRLAAELPILAEALHRGVPHVVRRRDLFVGDTALHRPPGALIHYATVSWRVATMTDDSVEAMSRALAMIKPTRRSMQPLTALSASPTAVLSFAVPLNSAIHSRTEAIDRPRGSSAPAQGSRCWRQRSTGHGWS